MITNSQLPAKFIGRLKNHTTEHLQEYVDEFVDLRDDPGHAGFSGISEAIFDAAKHELAVRRCHAE